jgi:hypothetical protein
VQFLTTSATIGVRGTDIDIAVTPGDGTLLPGTYLRVNKGAASLQALDGSTETVGEREVAVSIDTPLTARGAFPLVRRLDAAPASVFGGGRLDSLFR